MGRYILMFEPKYAYHQFAVYFNYSDKANITDVQITMVNKYSDIPCGTRTINSVKKNLLSDIDKIITPLTDLKQFFREYVDPSIFRYYGNNLHKIFIGYKDANRMKCLKLSINDPKLNEKLKFVQGSKIMDRVGKQEMIDLLVDPDSKFLNFVVDSQMEDKRNFMTSVSDSTIDIAKSLRRCRKMMRMESETGVFEEYDSLRSILNDKLSSYKEYREMFLIKNRYIYYLEEEKIRTQKLKEEAMKIEKETNKKRMFVPTESKYIIGEQLSLYDLVPNQSDKIKIKTLNEDVKKS